MASSPSSVRSQAFGSSSIQPYRMHVSQRYLDLTKKKLELTRLPRDPPTTRQNLDVGTSKSQLEPLVDHWSEQYNWRAQEAYYNDTLPQFRVSLHGPRLHFVHKRSTSPHAIPLLFVHGWLESFIAVSPMIDALCNPTTSSGSSDGNAPSFHVVVPSIPGFGFSDQIAEEGNNVATTAEVFDTLMKTLGYTRYIAHGSGWGFKICRLIALTHSESCVAVHTVNPQVPIPRHDSIVPMPSGDPSPPHSPTSSRQMERPQTISYALCDSPAGLLSYVVDAIRPQPPSPTKNAILRSTHWTSTALIDWTMIYWLPGPEVALRWLANSIPIEENLWSTYSNVLLAVTQFEDHQATQATPIWAEHYHRIAIVKRRVGNVRYPAWERPDDLVVDIRDLAKLAAPFIFSPYAMYPAGSGY